MEKEHGFRAKRYNQVYARPHPGPLPRGEGETLASLRIFLDRGLNPALGKIAFERIIRSHCGELKRPEGPAPFQLSKPFAAGVAGVEVVPEFDVVLVFFPAQKNLAPADDRREVQQPAINVLDHDFPALEFIHRSAKIRHGPRPFVDQVAAGIATGLHERAEPFIVFQQKIPRLFQLQQPFPNLRQ